jgi:hypothetical protein
MSGRLDGHSLWYEGAAHDDNGKLVWTGAIRSSGPGRGKCECGALSEWLRSGNARKAWHREHKAQVAKAAADG